MIQDLESFDGTSRATRALIRQASAIPIRAASDEQVEQWSEASESLIATLRQKLSKRFGTNENEIDHSVGELIRWFLERENALESLRATFPELHEVLIGTISRQGQRLSLYGRPADGSAHQILRSELDSLIKALKEVPNINDASAHSLAIGTLAEWLMRCPLDFPPYNHAG
jgi:hypothetical protein